MAALALLGCNSVLGLDERSPRGSSAGGFAAAGGTGGSGGVMAGTGGFGGGTGGLAGAGGIGGIGGAGGGGGAVVAESCDGLAGSATGVHPIDPDLDGPIQPFDAHCDMDFDGGGWTLIYSAESGMGPVDATSGVVLPGTNAYMPTATMTALAMSSAQVHIRTAGAAATRSATSVADSLPIENLRLGKMLERTAAAYSDTHWVMGSALTLANMRRFNMSQPCADAEAADPDYPQLYQACNNQNGLHIVGDLGTWDITAGPSEAMEVYLR